MAYGGAAGTPQGSAPCKWRRKGAGGRTDVAKGWGVWGRHVPGGRHPYPHPLAPVPHSAAGAFVHRIHMRMTTLAHAHAHSNTHAPPAPAPAPPCPSSPRLPLSARVPGVQPRPLRPRPGALQAPCHGGALQARALLPHSGTQRQYRRYSSRCHPHQCVSSTRVGSASRALATH